MSKLTQFQVTKQVFRLRKHLRHDELLMLLVITNRLPVEPANEHTIPVSITFLSEGTGGFTNKKVIKLRRRLTDLGFIKPTGKKNSSLYTVNVKKIMDYEEPEEEVEEEAPSDIEDTEQTTQPAAPTTKSFAEQRKADGYKTTKAPVTETDSEADDGFGEPFF